MKKSLYIIISAIAIIYSLWYGHFGEFSGNNGSMSKIGLSHPFLFAIWGILTYIALAYGIAVGYKKIRKRYYIPLLIISAIGMILTITCDFDYSLKTQYIAHCIGSLTFSAVSGITVFTLFLSAKNYILAAVSAVVLIGDLIPLLIFKETAIIELAPIFIGYILLGIFMFEKEKNTLEIK
ncbi:MAG: hypothetical protein LIO62_03525 [Clostridiales bacterium]|nr:hypothetical protein [Clostridiales bacterium]